MKLKDFIDLMEKIAPASKALPYDNVGLIVGTEREDISKVLVALDLTIQVANEAVSWGADMVLTHHPNLFDGVKRILPDHPETAAVYRLIKHGIGHFAAHTNLDAADGGVNDSLCDILGILNPVAIGDEGIARIGTLARPMRFSDFAALVKRRLGGNPRTVGGTGSPISRVAVLGGSGGGEIELAKKHGAEAYVTGEIKHSQAIAAEVLRLPVIEAGHYETEKVVLKPLISRLQAYKNGVQYRLADSDSSPFNPVN